MSSTSAPACPVTSTTPTGRSSGTAYGYDIRAWPEWTVLRDITELHSLGAHIGWSGAARSGMKETVKGIDAPLNWPSSTLSSTARATPKLGRRHW